MFPLHLVPIKRSSSGYLILVFSLLLSPLTFLWMRNHLGYKSTVHPDICKAALRQWLLLSTLQINIELNIELNWLTNYSHYILIVKVLVLAKVLAKRLPRFFQFSTNKTLVIIQVAHIFHKVLWYPHAVRQKVRYFQLCC